MARSGGSVFVDRRRKTDIGRGVNEIHDLISHGGKIAFFPEGTSSSGETVLPFKSSLFEVACERDIDVVALCIRYRDVEPIGRDVLFYFGEAEFLSHLWRLLAVDCIEVELEILSAMAGVDRKSMAREVQSQIASAYSA